MNLQNCVAAKVDILHIILLYY